MFEWNDIEEGKLTLNFSGVTSRLNIQIGIYAKYNNTTHYLEDVYPMVSISDNKNYSMSLNPSNALMFSSIMSVYTEEGTIKEYFNKTDISDGWYVTTKYVDKVIFKKVLTDKITLKIKPVTDERRIPLYQFNFIKDKNSISIDLTKAEIKSLILFFSNFASNASVYSFMFRSKNQYKVIEDTIDKISKNNLLLESILRYLEKPSLKSDIEYHPDDTLNVVPEIDFSNLRKEVNNNNIVKKVKKEIKKTDVIDIDSIEVANTSEIDDKIVEVVESTTGVKVGKKDSFDSVDIKKILAKEDMEVVEPLMEVSKFHNAVIRNYKETYINADTKFDLLNVLAKIGKVDRRLKNKSIVYNIAKKGILDPKAIPTLLVNKEALCTPATSLIYSASLFASVYEYNENHPNEDFNDIITIAYKALQLSSVEGQDLFANNTELKEYGNTYMNILTNMLLGNKNKLGIGGIRTIDKYLTLNHTYEKDNSDEVYFNFAYFDFSILDDFDKDTLNKKASCLVSALTDIYFVLWYGENKYIKDVKLSNTTGYMMEVVNKPMYELARAILINLVNRFHLKDIMLKGIFDFDSMVKYAGSWDYETYKDALVELISYKRASCDYCPYNEVLPLGSVVKNDIKVGMPCFNYSQVISD